MQGYVDKMDSLRISVSLLQGQPGATGVRGPEGQQGQRGETGHQGRAGATGLQVRLLFLTPTLFIEGPMQPS